MLETFLVKVKKRIAEADLDRRPKLIAMSATIPNLDEIGGWLCTPVYRTDFRPVDVKEYAKLGDDVYTADQKKITRLERSPVKGDWGGLWPLLAQTLKAGGQLLVFCQSKNMTEKYTAMFKVHIRDLLGIASDKEEIFECGVAYHHSGLSVEMREAVERLYTDHVVKVIFCTSTLAAGVNLPCDRVIISSLRQGLNSFITPITYKQMIGRAGRYGMSKLPADAYVCVQSSRVNQESPHLRMLMEISSGKKPLGQVISALSFERRGMYRIILDAIGNGLVCDQL